MTSVLSTLRQDTAGKRWWPRLPVVIWFGIIVRKHLDDPLYASLWDGLNLGIHEVGHVLFSPLGESMGVAGGTLTQLAGPIVAVILFARQRDWFAVTVGIFWLGTNMVDIATYMADARDLLLPLVSTGGGEIIHDWNYLLDWAGLLHRDQQLAALLRTGGIMTMLAGMGSGAAILLLMRESAVARRVVGRVPPEGGTDEDMTGAGGTPQERDGPNDSDRPLQ